MTPKIAIHKKCVECVGSVYEIKNCGGDKLLDGTTCHFYKFRNETGRPSVKVIRKFCMHCMSNSPRAVLNCNSKNCIVWQYRLGKNPAYVVSPAQKKALIKKLEKARRAKEKKSKNGGVVV